MFIAEDRKTVRAYHSWGEDDQGNRYESRTISTLRLSKSLSNQRFLVESSLVNKPAQVKRADVINNFVNPTSAYTKLVGTLILKDIFYNLRKAMLNVGLYLDDCPLEVVPSSGT